MAELVTIEEARSHLRVLTCDLDTEIALVLAAARGWCESHVSRTLQTSVSRTLSLYQWWWGRLDLPYPPLLGVTNVQYYDENNANQTLASTNYHAVVSADSRGWIEWSGAATQPSLTDRPDAVRITYTAGYTTAPANIKQAILLATERFWRNDDLNDLQDAERAARLILNNIDATSYA